MTGRIFAIGDIHGCRNALETLTESLELTPEDTLISLGDVVDRGPDSRGAVDCLLQLKKSCQLIFIMGNHEEMMLNAFRSKEDFRNWLMVGGRETLDSYGKSMRNIPESHCVLLAGGPNYYETETEIFIHANLEPGIPLDQQNGMWLRWAHLNGMEYPHESGKRVICGHTQQKSGLPMISDGWVCLDTGAYRGNPLSCLEVNSEMIHRADESGQIFDPQPLCEVAVHREASNQSEL